MCLKVARRLQRATGAWAGACAPLSTVVFSGVRAVCIVGRLQASGRWQDNDAAMFGKCVEVARRSGMCETNIYLLIRLGTQVIVIVGLNKQPGTRPMDALDWCECSTLFLTVLVLMGSLAVAQ